MGSGGKKAYGECKPWLSAKADSKESRFLMVGNSLLFNKHFQGLSSGAKHLYFCISMESAGRIEVEFPHRAAKKYGIAHTSFDRHIKELQLKGFLEKVGDGNFYQFAPSRYRFRLAWKQNPPPNLGRDTS